jgi:hypothetical protein
MVLFLEVYKSSEICAKIRNQNEFYKYDPDK